MERKMICLDFLGLGTEEKRIRFSGEDSIKNKKPVIDFVISGLNDSLSLNLNLSLAINGIDESRGKSNEQRQVSNSEYEVSSYMQEKLGLSEDELIKLKEGEEEYEFVHDKFAQGLGFLGRLVNIVGIHKNSHSGFLANTRLQSFQMYSEATVRKRGGNANIKYAWRLVLEDEVPGIIRYGFSLCGKLKIGNSYLLGAGLYLFAENAAINGVASSIKNEKRDILHMVLSRVIMGNMEQIPLGSAQFHPSSEEFDSGVDNLIYPRQYIVWGTHLNTHVLPEYILSFKVQKSRPKVSTGVARQVPETPVKMPSSPWIPFTRLITILTGVLTPPNITLLERYHDYFLEKKITRDHLIRKTRQIAGDELLISAIKSFRPRLVDAAAPSREESTSGEKNNGPQIQSQV